MEENQTTRHLARRDEKRLLRIATQAIKSDFPNPERLGCPGPDALKAIAHRRLSFPEADDVVDHIATCAPCFDEYTNYRRRYRFRVVSTLALACLAGLVAVAIILRFGAAHLPTRKQPVAQERSNPVMKATLDLRNRTVERSDRPQSPTDAEVPHVRRALLEIAIKLPIGMEDGVYAVQFRDLLGQPAANATGTAIWDGSAETLTTAVDLRELGPGKYTLAIRKGDSAWRTYPLVLD